MLKSVLVKTFRLNKKFLRCYKTFYVIKEGYWEIFIKCVILFKYCVLVIDIK